MGKRFVLVRILRGIVSNGLALLGAWALLEVVKRLIEARAPGPVDWSVPANTRLGQDVPTVAELVGDRLGPTLELLVLVMVLAMVLGALHVALFRRSSPPGSRGVLSALRLVWLNFWTSVPPFYLYLLILLVFAIWLHILPSGSAPAGAGLVTRLRYLLVPGLVLSLIPGMVLANKGLRELEARGAGLTSGHPYLLPAHVFLYMSAEALRMVGLILALAALVDGRNISRSLLFAGTWMNDAPIVVGLAWVMVIIVVVSRVLADLVQAGDEYILHRAGAGSGIPADGVSSRRGSIFTLGLALAVFGALAALALLSPWTAGYDPYRPSLQERLVSPSLSHLLGADYVGRDIFSRVVHALRFEFLISLVALAGVVLIAAPWGAVAVYLRERRSWPWALVREAVMWPVRVLTAFPWVALAVLVYVYNTGGLGTESGRSLGPGEGFSVYLAALLLILVPRGVRMCTECFSATSPSVSVSRRAVASIAVLVPMVTAVAVFVSINLGMEGLAVQSPRPALGLMYLEFRDYLSTMSVATLVGVSLAAVLLVFSLLLAGECLLERMKVRSGRVWSRGLE